MYVVKESNVAERAGLPYGSFDWHKLRVRYHSYYNCRGHCIFPIVFVLVLGGVSNKQPMK